MSESSTPLSDAELLHRLVGFDSTSRNSNLPIADFLCDYLDRPGVRIERQPDETGDKVNLVVTTGPSVDDERHGLTLSGHLDVVPADEPEWTGDPFELREAEDRYIGRGACDMKGFVALATNAFLRADSDRLKAPLALIFTFDEELGTLGARYFADHWGAKASLPRRTVIGEPTSLKVVRMHKGHASAELEIRGKAAHSGYPHLGHSAIEPLGRAITALSDLRRQLEAEACPNAEHFPEVPYVALSMATIEAGAAVNIVPERAKMKIGFRVLPGMQADDVSARIEERLATVLEGEKWRYARLNQSPPMLLAEDHDLNVAVNALAKQRETVSASYATDGGWLNHSGDFDCLLYGPGDIAVAHRPDEWVPKEEYHRCSRDLDRLVDSFCH